jgi:hypothetical protein
VLEFFFLTTPQASPCQIFFRTRLGVLHVWKRVTGKKKLELDRVGLFRRDGLISIVGILSFQHIRNAYRSLNSKPIVSPVTSHFFFPTTIPTTATVNVSSTAHEQPRIISIDLMISPKPPVTNRIAFTFAIEFLVFTFQKEKKISSSIVFEIPSQRLPFGVTMPNFPNILVLFTK